MSEFEIRHAASPQLEWPKKCMLQLYDDPIPYNYKKLMLLYTRKVFLVNISAPSYNVFLLGD